MRFPSEHTPEEGQRQIITNRQTNSLSYLCNIKITDVSFLELSPTFRLTRSRQKAAPFLTSSGAHSVHGGHGLPVVVLGVVALTGAEAVGPVEPPHSIEQPGDDSDTYTDPPGQHGGHQLPLVPFWVVPEPGTTHIHWFYG